MVEAKTGLKRALEKANNLEKDDFKQIKQWLKKDEDKLGLSWAKLSYCWGCWWWVEDVD